MKKALSAVAIAAAGFLAVAAAPRPAAPPARVDETALNAHIDARLQVLLGKLAREAEARQQLASR